LTGIVRQHSVVGLEIAPHEAIQIARRVLAAEGYESVAVGPTAATFAREVRPSWVTIAAYACAVPTLGLSLLALLIRVQEECTVTGETTRRGTTLSLSGVMTSETVHDLEAALYHSGPDAGMPEPDDDFNHFPTSGREVPAQRPMATSARSADPEGYLGRDRYQEPAPLLGGPDAYQAPTPLLGGGSQEYEEPATLPPPPPRRQAARASTSEPLPQGAEARRRPRRSSAFPEPAGFPEPAAFPPPSAFPNPTAFPESASYPEPSAARERPGFAKPVGSRERPGLPEPEPAAYPEPSAYPEPTAYPESEPSAFREPPTARRRSAFPDASPYPEPSSYPEPSAAPYPGEELDLTVVRPSPMSIEPVRSSSSLPRWVVTLDDGRTIDIPDFALIGRDPEPTADDPEAGLVSLIDPEMSVSKTHAAFGADDEGLWFLDRFSTNGTSMQAPGGERVGLEPGIATAVVPGSEIWIGRRHLTIDRAND
jgi:hypothetical protein